VPSSLRLLLCGCLWIAALAGGAALPAKAAEAPELLLARTLGKDVDVSRYLVSEKFDGIRAFWDGKTLRTRSGGVIGAPAWFVEKFPARPLDGELWAGRGRFEHLSGIVRKAKPVDDEWREVRYLVFELPEAPGTFRERAEALKQIAEAAGVPWLQAVEQRAIESRAALDEAFAAVLRAGGEGLMLHRADAPYATGRSDDLLKMKPFLDGEATVIGYVPGKGKYRGLLGALKVRTADGVEFRLGSGLSDALRRDPPPLGTVVTYRYRELTRRGIPRFASYYRVRDDF
jgi:DNA ligase-1